MSRPQSPVISEEPLLEPGLVTELVDNELEEDAIATNATSTPTPVYSIIYYPYYYRSNTQR